VNTVRSHRLPRGEREAHLQSLQRTATPREAHLQRLEVKIIAGKVLIEWDCGGFGAYLDMIQLQVDRGEGWADLNWNTTPGCTGTQPLPAALTTRKYRAIYHVGDEQVGLWSAEVSVVGGS